MTEMDKQVAAEFQRRMGMSQIEVMDRARDHLDAITENLREAEPESSEGELLALLVAMETLGTIVPTFIRSAGTPEHLRKSTMRLARCMAAQIATPESMANATTKMKLENAQQDVKAQRASRA